VKREQEKRALELLLPLAKESGQLGMLSRKMINRIIFSVDNKKQGGKITVREDKGFPEKDLIFRNVKGTEKTYALNIRTGETSGLGPEIDKHSSGPTGGAFSEKNRSVLNKFRQAQSDGRISEKIDLTKQRKHRSGSIINEKAEARNGPKSIVTLSNSELGKIAATHDGSGPMVLRKDGAFIEYFVCDKPIGFCAGTGEPSNVGVKVYSKTGCHIFPVEKIPEVFL